MHDLRIIIARDARAAGRECAEAVRAGDGERARHILRAQARALSGSIKRAMDTTAAQQFIAGYAGEWR